MNQFHEIPSSEGEVFKIVRIDDDDKIVRVALATKFGDNVDGIIEVENPTTRYTIIT